MPFDSITSRHQDIILAATCSQEGLPHSRSQHLTAMTMLALDNEPILPHRRMEEKGEFFARYSLYLFVFSWFMEAPTGMAIAAGLAVVSLCVLGIAYIQRKHWRKDIAKWGRREGVD